MVEWKGKSPRLYKDEVEGYAEDDQSKTRFTRDNNTPEPIELTDEEKAVLRECRINSLYFRGFPLGVVSAILTRYVANNYAPHIKRWSGFYYGGVFGLGILVGVASYRSRCLEKIMSLDNSKLADQVRDFQRRIGKMAPEKGSEFDNISDRQHAQEAALSKRNEKTEQGQHDSFQETPRDQGFSRQKQKQSVKIPEMNEDQGVSHEDLRRRHRARQQMQSTATSKLREDDDEDQDQKSFQYDPDQSYDRKESTIRPWNSDEGNRRSVRSDDKSENRTQKGPVQRNKYGDPVD